MTKTKKRRRKTQPQLRFNPFAWSKLRFLRDRGDSEIGGFGVSSAKNPLLVQDICLLRQRCTTVTVAFDDESVADYFDRMVDRELSPDRFARIWIHTHPGDCPLPSPTDEATFARVFGHTDWSVMAILARNDASFARLKFGTWPGGSWRIPVSVDFESEFSASDHDDWQREYQENVVVEKPLLAKRPIVPEERLCPPDWPYTHWQCEELQHDELGLAPL